MNHGIENSALTTYAGTLYNGGLDKYGPGTLVLSGDNVYTGPTNVIEGALRVAHPSALGTADSPTTVRHGASLEITGGTQSNEPIIASGPGFLGQGAIRSISGHNSFGDLSSGATGQVVVNVVADSLTVGKVELPLPADLRKDGPGRLSARRYRGGVVQVAEGVAAVTPGRSDDKTSVLLVLNIAPQAAQFDLGDNDLVWDYFSTSQLAPARSQIGTAYADGAWTGPGITSSLADDSNFALGYAESSEIFTQFPALFSGVLVDDTAVLVRFTRYGDANLDGAVTLQDFNRLATNFGSTDAVWSQGDFNYDGIVNLADFNFLAASFGQQAGPGGPTPEDWSNLASAIPEPAGGAVAIAALWLPLCTRGSRGRATRRAPAAC